MRMQILKIVVVLLVAGSGDARPQRSDDVNSATRARTSDAAGWEDAQPQDKTAHDTIRDDSRYTGTSGRNRKSYIARFRDSDDSSREHNAIGSRASGFAPMMARSSFNARRPKIDDIWTTSEFKASSGLSRPNVLGEIAEIGAVRNSHEANGPLLGGLSNNLTRSVLASNKGVSSDNLDRRKSDVTLNTRNYKFTVARTRYSSGGNSFLASHASGAARTSDDVSIATKNRQKSSSIKSLSNNKRITGDDDASRRKTEEQVSNVPFSHVARPQVSLYPRESAVISSHSIRNDRNSIRKSTSDSRIVTSRENLKQPSNFAIDSFRHVVDAVGRDDLNNSSEPARPTLIPNPKSKIAGYERPVASRGHATNSNRNFVKLRYPFSTSNRNNGNVESNSKLEDDNSDDVRQREPIKSHLTTRTAARRPDSNDRATFKPTTKDRHSSHAQNLSSQAERVDGGDETRVEYIDGTSAVPHKAYLKNWPNETLENLYNYEKYTSSLKENSNNDSGFHDVEQTPMILSSDDGSYNHPDPIIDASVKKIVHWLKVATIVPNGTQFVNDGDDVRKPIDSVFESIYGNLEPNRPLSVGNHDDDRYEAVVLQDTSQNQNPDGIDYHENYSNLAVRPQHTTDPAKPSPTVTSSSWSDATLLKNKTVYNPTTHVTQNTVVQILNDGPKEPNATQSAGQATSSSEGKEPPKQETNTLLPSSTYNCPTITINTYTRVNNTIESKEGCTDLNIIVNSHVLSTNIFKPSDGPTELDQQSTSLATEGYGDGSDKYAEEIADDLSHQDSSDSYVTASIGTYGPLEVPRPGQHDYYDSQKDPSILDPNNDPVSSELSTVEVFQNTQISVHSSGVPLTDSVAEGPAAGSSDDGPAVGDGAAALPAAAGASASGQSITGNPGSVNLPASGLFASFNNPVKGQSIHGPGTLQLSALPNIPRPSLPSTGGLAVPQGSLGSVSPEDDDDDFDMSPGGLMQSVASVFTYFSLLNPLGYSFFSLAAAPFAAMAAGMIGVAAVVFPWAIPSVLDFGRSADKVTIKFRPNLEEFVKQAVHKYDGLNEWKSRRKKRRR